MNREKLIKHLEELIKDERTNITNNQIYGQDTSWNNGFISACEHMITVLNQKNYMVIIRNESGSDRKYFYEKAEAEQFASRVLRASYYDTATVEEVDTY